MKYLLLLPLTLISLFANFSFAYAQTSVSPSVFYCVGNNPQPPCVTIAPTQSTVNSSPSVSPASSIGGTINPVSGIVSPSVSISVTPSTGTGPNIPGGVCTNLSQLLNTLVPIQTSTNAKIHIKCEPANSGGGSGNGGGNPNNGLISKFITLLVQLIMQLFQLCGMQPPTAGTPTISGTPSISPASSVSSTPSSGIPSSVVATPTVFSVSPSTGTNTPPTGNSTLKIGNNAPPAGTNAVVDFRKNLSVPALNVYSIGDTISEFGYPNNNIANATWRSTLAKLGPLAWRLALRMNGNSVAAGAGGGNGDGTAYVKDIRAMNGVPVVIAAGKTGDYDIDPNMSVQLVHYFNDGGGRNGGPVKIWIIGNEPDNGNSGGYIGALNATTKAMKQADPSIQISAPAASHFDDGLMGAANNTAGQYINYMSYHAYTGGDGQGVYSTPEFLTEAQHVKNSYGKTPALEEFNWNFRCAGGNGYSDWEGGVYIASVIGNSLAGGAGHAYMYADSGGCGTLYNGGAPMPAYYGLGIWTGMNGQFDRFGSQLVNSSVGGVDVTNGGKSGLSQQVELFAMNNGKIVAINKNGGAENITIGLGGLTTGSYTVWQTDTTGPIKEVRGSTNFTGSKITITLPGHTVSSIDVQ
ncbi:MAG TPA: hypothetical protein VND99_05885 [Candidatus Acidoferrales bacterium]|nr:hypothetical protein [Candidatus Acidoferrales bacterium]